MAAKQLKASIIIDLTGNLVKKAGEFGHAIDRMVRRNSAAINVFSSNIRTLSNNIDRMGNRAVMSAGAIGYAFNRTFIKTAAMFERFQIQSASLFGGPEKGQQALAWAKQNAKDTVLSLQQVMQLMTEMKGFGMNPMDGKLSIMENVAAQHGWQFDQLHGAMAQIEQMYSKQKISADDAKILSAYGVNIYQELSKATGIAQKRIMQMGEKGMLGNKALEVFFNQLDKESKGASAAAMKTWDGLLSNLGDDWEQWQQNVMNRGVFDKLKNKLRQFKNFTEDPSKANPAAHNTAAILNHSIDMATAAASGLWEVFKGIGNTVDYVSEKLGIWAVKLGLADSSAKSANETLTGVKYLAEGMAALYLGNKAVRLASPLLKGGFTLGKLGYKTIKGGVKAGRWSWRRLFGKTAPAIDSLVSGAGGAAADKVMNVFVTNWPDAFGAGGGGSGYGSGADDKESRKSTRRSAARRRLRSRTRMGRFANRVESLFSGGSSWRKKLSGLGSKGKELFSKVSGLIPENIINKGKSLLGKWGGKIPFVGAAFAAADAATAKNSTEMGGSLGGTVGSWIGGALGTLTDEFTGPFGTLVGAQIGQSLGDKLGQMLGSLFDDKKEEKPASTQPAMNGRIDLNIKLPPGASVGSSYSSFYGSSPFNLMTGGYIP